MEKGLLQTLKQDGSDHEFYPTTNEIIEAMTRDIVVRRNRSYGRHISSVLDIGAGDGKVLRALAKMDGSPSLYAMEKSLILCERLSEIAFVIGTDFMQQSLLSKSIDLTFCNPPYSEFIPWAVKIIRESASEHVYLVIPERWSNSVEIADALKYRGSKAEVVGSFDFENSEDRRARAKVQLLWIWLGQEKDDAFDRFFDNQFAHLKQRYADSEKPEKDKEEDRKQYRELVKSKNIIEALAEMYGCDMDKTRHNYELAAALDVDLLKELHVKPDDILRCLKDRLAGLRNEYWHELFGHMSEVTRRLCTKQRARLLDTLNANGHVDFTVGNAYAVMLWVLRNASKYMDEQTIQVFDRLVEKATIRNYKSNQKVWEEHNWRYGAEKPTHVYLEYRMVLECVGGIHRSEWSSQYGLEDRAGEALRDLMTVANNLGFTCDNTDIRLMTDRYRNAPMWKSGKGEEFYCIQDGKSKVLFEVKAFYNGNLHLRMSQDFALALNVENGRLRGWLRTPQEAADELDNPEAVKYFGTAFQLTQRAMPLLEAAKMDYFSEFTTTCAMKG